MTMTPDELVEATARAIYPDVFDINPDECSDSFRRVVMNCREMAYNIARAAIGVIVPACAKEASLEWFAGDRFRTSSVIGPVIEARIRALAPTGEEG